MAQSKITWGGYRKGAGRPAKGPRCECGAMSKKRAAQKRHKCSPAELADRLARETPS